MHNNMHNMSIIGITIGIIGTIGLSLAPPRLLSPLAASAKRPPTGPGGAPLSALGAREDDARTTPRAKSCGFLA